jgi:crotonobetainyl-CoA:carnitine CoA-transferase CaiB-like acyl-CoA transferase
MNGPLDGKIRVLDISMGWAGPLAGQMFAEMDAEVIKVEDTRHFDWWRGSLSMAPPEMQPIERASVFNTANRGKLGVTLDLSNPRGIEIVKRLVNVSDILIENYSAGVIERFGLGYSILSAINPRLIMVSMPSFGSEGPDREARGYGNTVEAMAGVTGLAGYHDSPQRYTLSNALGDPVGGLHGVLALLAAIYERERTGRGQHIEIAQVEAAIPLIAGAILEYQLTGREPVARGNRHPRHAPHGIYRCASEHAWIALAAESDEQWRAVTRALGLEKIAEDPRFTSAERRKDNEDALDAEVGLALALLNLDDAVAKLSAAGVYAAAVNSAPAVMADEQIQARGYFVPIERAIVGTHLYPGAVARLAATPLHADRPAPLLGEHNHAVLGGLLKMSAAEISELERAGIIGTQPRTA